jgi:hypothetical protein
MPVKVLNGSGLFDRSMQDPEEFPEHLSAVNISEFPAAGPFRMRHHAEDIPRTVADAGDIAQ